MDCLESRGQRKPELRPCCPNCAKPGWFDGWRFVKLQAKLTLAGVLVWVRGLWRRRARCPYPDCPVRSWTVYEDQGYPHRTFPPSVAAAAVTELLFRGAAALEGVAGHWGCCPGSLVRWLDWIGGIVGLAILIKVCWACYPSGMPPPTFRVRQDPEPAGPAWRSRMALAGSLVLLFERFARLLRDQGVPLAEGPGLAAFLRFQRDRFRLVSWLTKPSPPLVFDGLWSGG
jgi:hypothetical protein